MPRLTGIQSEPNSVESYSSTVSSRTSSTNQQKNIQGNHHQKSKGNSKYSNSVDYVPNVPPAREKNLRIAVGNAILAATTGMAAVSIESKFSSSSASSTFSSRPSTSASGISANTIPLSFASRLSTTMTKVSHFTVIKI